MQICLPHCTYLSRCTNTVVNIQTAHISKKTYLPCYCHICSNNKYSLHMPHMKISSFADTRELCQYIYTSFELTAINNVTRNNAIHIFHIIGLCTWKKYACHIADACPSACLLDYIHTQHYCTYQENKEMQYAHAIAMCQQQICPFNATKCRIPNYPLYINERSMQIYIQHINSLASNTS